jgi:type VI protein secretion system component VasK
MMLDIPTRLVIAYGLIAAMALFALAVVLWKARNSRHRRGLRAQARLAERYRQRDEAAAELAAAEH